jgi:site-specific recombinase XerD
MNAKSRSTLEKYESFLRVKGYSERTISIYLCYASKFLAYFNKDIYHISNSDIENYFLRCDFSSKSKQNQIINSIKLLFRHVAKKEIKTKVIERPRKEKRLPKIIDKDFLLERIDKIENLKHKAVLSLAASVGLRVSEVINLKISDIDSKRMVITIRQAKGRKDRIVPLSENILFLLRKYFKQFNPKEYLFNGQKKPQYTASSCNELVKKYIGEEYHFHLLRHFAFTNLVDQGTDISIVQKLAGHSSIKTTSIYLHLSTSKMQNLPLAL